jgi:Lrp/AsnC family transcriptional regulator, regulator for asnA, asnC and gidA
MPQIIDPLNAKILRDLLEDGRKTFTQIAKENNTSKDVITKRYKQMKNAGIIVGATVHNSPACYGANLVAGIYLEIKSSKEKQVLELVKKIPQFLYVYNIGIHPGLAALLILKNIEELEGIKELIKKMPYILGFEIIVLLGIRTSPENLSILSSQDDPAKKYNIIAQKRKIEIDKIDTEIIERLAANGRVTFREIADELKISTDTIKKRYTKLKQNGDIKVVIQIDPTKIGYSAFAIFNLAFSEENSPSYILDLAKIPDVNFVIKTSGSFDVMLSLMICNIQQLIAVQEKIASMPGLIYMQITLGKLFNVWPLPREFTSTF